MCGSYGPAVFLTLRFLNFVATLSSVIEGGGSNSPYASHSSLTSGKLFVILEKKALNMVGSVLIVQGKFRVGIPQLYSTFSFPNNIVYVFPPNVRILTVCRANVIFIKLSFS